MQSFLLKTVKKIKKNIKLTIILASIYLIGFILGIIFSNKNLCNNILKVNINNYYFLVFNVSINVFKPFFNCLLTGVLLTLAVSAFGFTTITVYLFSIVIFYKGLVLGTSLLLFYSLSNISGLLTFIILTLPTNVLITSGLIICNVLNYENLNTCNLNVKFKKILLNALISIVFTFVASIYFLFLLITVIRPINLLF